MSESWSIIETLKKAYSEINMCVDGCIIPKNVAYTPLHRDSVISKEEFILHRHDVFMKFSYKKEFHLQNYCIKFLNDYLSLDFNEGDYYIHGTGEYNHKEFKSYPDLCINKSGISEKLLFIEFKTHSYHVNGAQNKVHTELRNRGGIRVDVCRGFIPFLQILGEYFLGESDIFLNDLYLKRLILYKLVKHTDLYCDCLGNIYVQLKHDGSFCKVSCLKMFDPEFNYKPSQLFA